MTLYSKLEKHLPRELDLNKEVMLEGLGQMSMPEKVCFNACKAQYDEVLKREKEVIICSAIKLADGQIYRGHRHGDCVRAIEDDDSYLERKTEYKGHIQGFMTSMDRFVGREEAMNIFIESGKKPAREIIGNLLMSEDLY